MNLLALGRGKTGALVAAEARERGHQVTSLGRQENEHENALTAAALDPFDVVIDFTVPEAVVPHIQACARAGKNMVVGTTGWYEHMAQVRKIVEQSKIKLVWGGNFSVGMNVFYAVTRAAAAAAKYGYAISIRETHHVHKKDAPSGTAMALRRILESSRNTVPIESVREGEIMGRHQVTLASAVDVITLTHEAKSRRGFAEGAVRAAEWIAMQPHPGVYDFSEIFDTLLP